MRTRSWLVAATACVGLLPCFDGETHAEASSASTQGKDDPDSAKTCARCHTTIYDEWKGRAHNNAWDDPIYQAKLKTKKRPKSCYSCHIPMRVLARTGRKPKTRKKLLHEGVNCVACHEKDGHIHGPFGAKTDAHPSVKDPLFTDSGSSGLCISCHETKIDVVLPVGRDYAAFVAANPGKSCASCHRPAVERHLAVSIITGKPVGEKRKGRSHKLLGPSDPEFCAKAFELRAKKAADQLLLIVDNKAGHRVPGLRIRAFHFLVRQQDAKGKQLSEDKLVVDSENGLKVLETRQFPFDLRAGAAKVEVVIQHVLEDKLVAKILEKTLNL